jgi:hypothetical protein
MSAGHAGFVSFSAHRCYERNDGTLQSGKVISRSKCRQREAPEDSLREKLQGPENKPLDIYLLVQLDWAAVPEPEPELPGLFPRFRVKWCPPSFASPHKVTSSLLRGRDRELWRESGDPKRVPDFRGVWRNAPGRFCSIHGRVVTEVGVLGPTSSLWMPGDRMWLGRYCDAVGKSIISWASFG